MKYKLVGIDMDGTLLNSKNQITERTKKAIKEAEKKGIKVVIATGRILGSALDYANSLKLKNPLIASNGSVVVDEFENVVYEKAIEKDKVREIIELGISEEIYFHLYDKTNFYSRVRSEEVLKFYNESSQTIKIDMDLFNDPEEILKMKDLSIYKFIFIDRNEEKLQKFRQKIEKIKDIEASSSWKDNIEVMAKGVSKGNALKELCRNLYIDPKEVIAIGDRENDLSMLSFAGLGVSMGNASDKVKNESDYITDSNDEDGVAKVIEKFILN